VQYGTGRAAPAYAKAVARRLDGVAAAHPSLIG